MSYVPGHSIREGLGEEQSAALYERLFERNLTYDPVVERSWSAFARPVCGTRLAGRFFLEDGRIQGEDGGSKKDFGNAGCKDGTPPIAFIRFYFGIMHLTNNRLLVCCGHENATPW
jgi:hypothetical protein